MSKYYKTLRNLGPNFKITYIKRAQKKLFGEVPWTVKLHLFIGKCSLSFPELSRREMSNFRLVGDCLGHSMKGLHTDKTLKPF